MKKVNQKKSNSFLFLRILTGIFLTVIVAGVKVYPEIWPENIKKAVYYTAKHNFNISELKNTVKSLGVLND